MSDWFALYRAHARLPSHRRRVDRARTWLDQVLSRSPAWAVSFSGGKDSLAVLCLVCDVREPSRVAVFTQGDDLDWPSKRTYCEQVSACLGIRDYTYQVSRVSAHAQLVAGAEAIRGTFSHVWRGYVRDRGIDAMVLGLRSAESRARRLNRAVRGTDYRTQDGLRHLLPIADWSAVDVMAYLSTQSVPLFELYTWPDPALPPHERRMSWPVVPGMMAHGEAAFVRRHAPGLWNRLAAEAPHIATEV